MAKSWELYALGLGQDLLQGVQAGLQVGRALAAAEQKHVSAYCFETLKLPAHLDDKLQS